MADLSSSWEGYHPRDVALTANVLAVLLLSAWPATATRQQEKEVGDAGEVKQREAVMK